MIPNFLLAQSTLDLEQMREYFKKNIAGGPSSMTADCKAEDSGPSESKAKYSLRSNALSVYNLARKCMYLSRATRKLNTHERR